ncbi:MAG TPA: hypothetical protein VFY93_08660 [Planctomycetota bacterium]|nr:hypothetical protein [Planctomycetota bacterium]
MGRTVLTIFGIAAIAVGAVFIAQRFANPAKERVQQGQKVLTQAYEPQYRECYQLQDSEIPAGLPKPGVDEDLIYVAIVVLYPGVERVPEPKDHRLIGINGENAYLEPVNIDYEVTEEGAELTLVFRTDNGFRFARLVRGDKTISDHVGFE